MNEALNNNLPEAELQGKFLFKHPVFEGPLDLLLHLIKEEKIDIYDIPIVHITNQYIEYLDLMKELDLEIAGEFLVMAATLIHIKTRMLLPAHKEESEAAIEDPRSELVRRLLEYQAYKDSSSHLRKKEDTWKNIFHRPLPEKNDFDFEPEPLFDEMSAFDLLSAFRELLKDAPIEMLEITREKLTVSEKINFLIERLEKEDGIRFQDLFEGDYTKVSLIVTFLALLEVSRLGLARIYQEKRFTVIWIINPEKMGIPPTSEVSAVTETNQ